MINNYKTLSLISSLIFLCCFSTCQNPTGEKNDSKGLRDYANFPIGGAISIKNVLKDEKLKNITEENFNSITATNDMKMYSIAAEEGQYNWENADSLVAFCERNDQRLFGHTLVWHYGLPQWIVDKGTLEGSAWVDSFLQSYITRVVSRYKGKVAAWDVVNEAFESGGGNLRETFWYQHLGKEYIAKAFQYAHAADPEAELFYNDFNIERDTAKLHAVLKMIETLQSADIPITGLGFQMHLRMDIPDEEIGYALKTAAATGLQIHISELDIIFNKHNDSPGGGLQEYARFTPEMDKAQAEKYKTLVMLYRKHVPKDQQYGITFWDFTDRDTWIKDFFNIEDWPTVYDEELNPKGAYYGFLEGLKAEL
jgi:endo-1,4-beta-xylanase